MKTIARIFFTGDGLPGGAHAILAVARCGPDVALVEEAPALRKKEDVEVNLDAADPRLAILLNLLHQHNWRWLDLRWDVYTDEELNHAPLIHMEPVYQHQIFGGPRVGTRYDMTHACPSCGAGARQTSALIIQGEDLPKLKGRRAGSTYYSDIIVKDRFAEELSSLGLTGLSFRDVSARMANKQKVKLPWKQLCARRTLPKMARSTVERHRMKRCPSCERSGFNTDQNLPPRLAYHAKDLAEIDDVNLTWEWFGEADFDGKVSKALFPYPFFLVTPKVMHAFRKAGVTEFNWLAVRVEDECSSSEIRSGSP